MQDQVDPAAGGFPPASIPDRPPVSLKALTEITPWQLAWTTLNGFSAPRFGKGAGDGRRVLAGDMRQRILRFKIA